MKADLVIKGNAIFDSIVEKPFPGFIAVNGKKISYVGHKNSQQATRVSIDEFIGPDTKVIDAGEKLIMPGFHDAHVHLLMTGMFSIFPDLIGCRSEEETAKKMADFGATYQDKDGWIVGFQWYHVFWDKPVMPNKKTLDQYFPDRPVFLLNAEAHGAWVNSKGLELAGIDKDTPNPFAGIIEKDENGEPTGVLLEGAVALASKFALTFKQDKQKELLKAAMESCKAYGITSVADVMPYFHGNMGDIPAYAELDQAGEFTFRVHAAPDLLGDLDQVVEWGKKYNSEKLTVNHVKQFLDGVYTTYTALLLDDYSDKKGEKGIPLFDLEAIKKAVPEAHKRGLSVRLHACGDRSVQYALDYFENAIRLNGRNWTRPTIEHNELVSEDDLPRFRTLGVIPSCQPEHEQLTPVFSENPYPGKIGEERSARNFPYRDLLNSATVLGIGSDCPVVDSNPFLEIFRAVTRVANDGCPKGGWAPDQKLTLTEILKQYTYGSAYVSHREHEIGTLAKGYFADIVILNNNLFEIPEEELIDGKVDVTIFDGKIIYER